MSDAKEASYRRGATRVNPEKDFANHPLHYIYALNKHKITSSLLDCRYFTTIEDQIKVEKVCLEKYRECFPLLSPHPLAGEPDLNSTCNSTNMDEEAIDAIEFGEIGIQDQDFIWQHAANKITLKRANHIAFASKHLSEPLSFLSVELAASRTWLIYWMTHSLSLLDALNVSEHKTRILDTLNEFWDKGLGGGWGGGINQQAHLATTYSATCSLFTAEAVLDWFAQNGEQNDPRKGIYNTLMKLKDLQKGGFRMHQSGEVDMRGVYCAIATASMFQMLTPELIKGVPEYIARAQGYDGGIAGAPGLESHGGYTYCGLAVLCILGRTDVIDLDLLLNWTVSRQMGFEGGFQGRTGKLVDSCYSFWQGATLMLIGEAFRQQNRYNPIENRWMSCQHLQQYIMCCCQSQGGGFVDKPGMYPDLYHTCYALSGLSLAQHGARRRLNLRPAFVLGSRDANLLVETDPHYNICVDKMQKTRAAFSSLQIPVFVSPTKNEKGFEGAGTVAYYKWLEETSVEDKSLAERLLNHDSEDIRAESMWKSDSGS